MNDNGWSRGHELMQALSHFSYDQTGGEYVLCDLQGVCDESAYTITDPAVLSANASFGPTDGGAEQIKQFFAHHKCGAFCSKSQPHLAT